MTRLLQCLLFVVFLPGMAVAQDAVAPWTLPRDLSQFQILLNRSPFSLPTAEESSPLADRFTLTGAVSINDEPMVFVLDKTSQERHMVTKTPNPITNLSLVEFFPDPDARRMRATIRVGSEVATISYAEPATPPGQQTGMQPPPGMPSQNPSVSVNAPNQQAVPGRPSAPTTPRRVIRRRVISGQPTPGP